MTEGKGLNVGRFRSLLFAAGKGRRLRPLTERWPKPVVPVLDVPLAAMAVERLRETGHCLVNAAAGAGVVRAELGAYLGCEGWELFDEGDEPLGTARTLVEVAGRAEWPLLTWNGDALLDLQPQALRDHHDDLGVEATIVCRRVSSGADFVRDGSRYRFIDRRTGDEPGVVFCGVAIYEEDVAGLARSIGVAGMGAVLTALSEKDRLGFLVHEGHFVDAGTPGRYLRANRWMLREPDLMSGGPPGEVRPTGYLGPGARASEASLVADAIVLAGATVEPGASLENAVVMPGETVPGGMVVRDGVFFQDEIIPAPDG